MKQYSKLLFAIFIATLLASCSTGGGDAQYLAFKVSKSDKWGIIDGNGKIIIEDEFKNLPTPVSSGVFFVADGEGLLRMYSISDPTKEIDSKFKTVGAFNESADCFPAVKKGGCIKYIDKKGEERFALSNDYERAISFNNGWSLAVKDDGTVVAFDSKGNSFESKKYNFRAVVGKDKFAVTKDDVFYIINSKEEELVKFKDIPQDVSDDVKYYTFKDDGMMGLKTIDGEVVLRAKYELLVFSSKVLENTNFLIFSSGDKSLGLMKFDGEIVLKDKYVDINGIKDNMFIVKREKGEGWGIVNKDGDKVLGYEYDELNFINGTDNLLAKKEGDKSYYIINIKGEPISKNAEFYELVIPKWDASAVRSDL